MFDADAPICRVEGWAGTADAGLHPLTGGDGSLACSADMLLEALVACAGVILKAVAIAMDIPLNSARVIAEGTFDARGTWGIDKQSSAGMRDISLTFEIQRSAERAKLYRFIELSERYCVIYQTLKRGLTMSSRADIKAAWRVMGWQKFCLSTD